MSKVKFSDKPTNEKANSIALCLSMVVLVGAIVVGAFSSISYNSEYDSLSSQYDELKRQYDAIQDKSVEVDEATVILNSAKDAGIAVAAIQNQMAVDSNLIGTENENIFVEEANSLKDYFSGMSACYPWYVTNVLTDFTWEFNTTYSFTASEVPVLWTCYGTIPGDEIGVEDKTVLLAYATGTYSVESGLFIDVDVEITSLGNSNQTAIDGATSNLTELTTDDDYYIDENGDVVIKHADSDEADIESETETDVEDETNTEIETEEQSTESETESESQSETN